MKADDFLQLSFLKNWETELPIGKIFARPPIYAY